MNINIRNPFRNNRDKARMFDACVEVYLDGGFVNRDGSQNRGGSHKISFWNGFNGVKDSYTDPQSLGWAAYRAGQACAKLEKENA